MPIESGDKFLPPSQNMVDAFRVVDQHYFMIPNSLDRIRTFPIERLQQAAGDYVTTGVAYLANRGHDDYMQEVGTTMWWAFNQDRAFTGITNDIVGATIELEVPPEIARKMYSDNSEPQVLIRAIEKKKQAVEIAVVLLPPDFLYAARNKPVEALGMMAWIGSQIRDFANGRMLIDPEYIAARSRATEAHFLHEVRRRYPDMPLGPVYETIMEYYPEGIQSLPPKARYRGTAADAFKSAHLN